MPKIHIRPVFSRFALCLQDCCAFLETSPWIKVWYSKESMRVVSTPQLLSSFFVVPSAKLRKSETSQMFEVSYEILRELRVHTYDFKMFQGFSRLFDSGCKPKAPTNDSTAAAGSFCPGTTNYQSWQSWHSQNYIKCFCPTSFPSVPRLLGSVGSSV